MPTPPFQGSCLCQRIRFTATRLIGPYVYCHCRSCRKSSGTAFAANIAVPAQSFNITMGEALIAQYESTPGKVRHFCSVCGSPLFTKVGAQPEFVRVRLGSLDSAYAEQCSAHIFVGDKAPWHEIDSQQVQFAEWPDAQEVQIPGSRQRKIHQ